MSPTFRGGRLEGGGSVARIPPSKKKRECCF